jgi:tRNA(fMet)-specific endonuclease VapC
LTEYLLDTKACIAIIKRNAAVQSRFDSAVAAHESLFVSSVAIFELAYGIAKSRHRMLSRDALNEFLAGPVEVIDFDLEDAETAGQIRGDLEAVGRPIGPYDILIAAQALRRELTLITSNVSEFRRIKGLRWEDWAKAS